MHCPKCHEEFEAVATASVPDSQRSSIEMESEASMFSAEVIGEVLTSYSRMMAETARCLGVTVVTFVEKIELTPGKIRVDFIIAHGGPLPQPPQEKPE